MAWRRRPCLAFGAGRERLQPGEPISALAQAIEQCRIRNIGEANRGGLGRRGSQAAIAQGEGQDEVRHADGVFELPAAQKGFRIPGAFFKCGRSGEKLNGEVVRRCSEAMRVSCHPRGRLVTDWPALYQRGCPIRSAGSGIGRVFGPRPASAGRGGRTTVTVQHASPATFADTPPSSERLSEFCRAPTRI